jgi:23S rRNA pseudouridine2605 synthase
MTKFNARLTRHPVRRGPGRVALNRALSKLGILSRAEATVAIRAGRVRIDGRLCCDPERLVIPELVRVDVDGLPEASTSQALDGAPLPGGVRRVIAFYKPRGVVTTRRDPEGRQTVFDVLGEAGLGLIAVGRLDLATSGLLLLTNDTQLAHALTDPANAVPRVYLVTVRGRVTDDELTLLRDGIPDRGETLRAHAVSLRKASNRESHLTIELREGKNREVRRLFKAVDHEVTALKRVRFGAIELAGLSPGGWRDVSAEMPPASLPRPGR